MRRYPKPGFRIEEFDALDRDLVASDVEVDRLLVAFPHDGHRHLGPSRAAHHAHGLAQVAGQVPVHLDDAVAGLEAGLVRRGVLDRRNDRDEPVLHRDVDADAGELALGVDLQVLEGVGRQQRGVRVEPLEHPVDGLLDQVLGIDFVDVLFLDQLDYVREHLELLVEVFLARGRTGLLEPGAEHPHHHGRNHDDPDADGSIEVALHALLLAGLVSRRRAGRGCA